MNTYIVYNAHNYDSLEEALVDGAGKVIRTSLDLEALEALLHDVTGVCCHVELRPVPVRGLVARELGTGEQ